MTGKKRHKILLGTTAGFAAAALIAAWVIFWSPNSFEGPPRIVTVSKGQSFSRFADSLQRNGIISSVSTFKLAGKLYGITEKMRVGRYRIPSGTSNLGILRDIKYGLDVVLSRVTVVEGSRATQIAHTMRNDVGIDSARFISILKDTSLIGFPHTGSASLEGYLLPDTYDFSWQTDEKQIVERLVAEFRQFFVDSLQERARQMRLSVNEVLAMASIVEGEAVYDDERPVIAGVYYNRLRRRMKLQADPTIQYVVAERPRRLTYDDLSVRSPYNTYRHYGLPPGPINNPGRSSILAALYPAQHHYLYFVSDHNGRHRFSTNYAEHMRNVRAYRRARAKQQ